MNIYERATHSIGNNMSDVYDMYLIYISRAAQYYGVTKTRDIYEQAIHYLEQLLSSPNSTIGDVKYIRDMCLKYADLEKKLGEIDRSRAIYAHCAKYCDPRVDQAFWQSWTQFEKLHGNIDTFKEMLRIKRSVETQNATVNVMTRGMLQAQEEREKLEEEHKQIKLKRKREDIGGDVSARDIESLEQSKNPDELDI
jgi:pre-mRNA-splicing factor SYF1